jgi:hypothetical protein
MPATRIAFADTNWLPLVFELRQQQWLPRRGPRRRPEDFPRIKRHGPSLARKIQVTANRAASASRHAFLFPENHRL